MRIAESDCLDGKDNNGDGLADCMDPTCAPQVACVPIGPGGSQLGVLDPNCPTGFGPGTVEKSGFQDTSCGGCTCTTVPICQVENDIRANGGCSLPGPNGYPQGPPGTEACVNVAVGTYVQFYTDPVSTVGHSCNVGGAPSRPSPSFASSATFCPTQRTSATCDSTHVCAPKPPAADKICVSMPGSVSGCPTGFSTGPTTYAQGAQTGGCSACPSSCSAGSSPNCSANAMTYAYGGLGCTGAQYSGSVNNCNLIASGGATIQSTGAIFFSDNGADNCSVTQPTTSPSTLIGQATICCM